MISWVEILCTRDSFKDQCDGSSNIPEFKYYSFVAVLLVLLMLRKS